MRNTVRHGWRQGKKKNAKYWRTEWGSRALRTSEDRLVRVVFTIDARRYLIDWLNSYSLSLSNFHFGSDIGGVFFLL